MAESADVGRANRAVILAALFRDGVRDRATLSGRTGLSAATVSRVVDGLVGDGLLSVTAGDANGRRGRPIDVLTVCAARGVVTGIDLSADRCRITVSDLVGEPLADCVVPTARRATGATLASWVATQLHELAAHHLAEATYVCTVVAVPAAVDRDGRRVYSSSQLPQLRGVAFADRLQRRLGGIVELDKQVHTALHGELTHGAARGSPAAVLLTISAGVEAAFALGGHIIPGDRGLVGSFGLLTAQPDRPPLEKLPNSTTRPQGVDVPYATLLNALATVTVAYDPDLIVLAATPTAAPRTGLIAQLARDLTDRLSHAPRLVQAQLADRSVLIGARSRALDLLHISLGLDPIRARLSPTEAPRAVARLLPSGPVPESHRQSRGR